MQGMDLGNGRAAHWPFLTGHLASLANDVGGFTHLSHGLSCRQDVLDLAPPKLLILCVASSCFFPCSRGVDGCSCCFVLSFRSGGSEALRSPEGEATAGAEIAAAPGRPPAFRISSSAASPGSFESDTRRRRSQ